MMNEANKTLAFLLAGVVSLGAAYVVTSAPSDFDPAEEVGTILNAYDVEDPKSLRIIKVAPNGLELDEFEVAEQNGTWSIPSKQGYPADATEQMAAAATGLLNREKLRVQAKSAEEHADLGLLNPSDADLDGNATGVGMRVVMTDIDGKTLVDMIIGNEVKDNPGQYYVRNTNQDIAYVVDVDPEKLTTKFEDWIEDDLLKLDPFNIQEVFINDYSAELTPVLAGGRIEMRIGWDRRSQMTLDYNNDDAKWEAVKLVKFPTPESDPEPVELGADEELNQDALRELRNGLDDLLIVDIERKPAGLSADLKAGDDFLNNNESVNNLVSKGFAPVPLTAGGPLEILSSEGEVVCTMKNGVEYVLRFGKLSVNDGAEAEAENEGEQPAGGKLNRYLFVSARFNEDAVETPDYAELPPLPEGVEEPSEEEESDAAGANEAGAADTADAEDAESDEAVEEEEEEDEVADEEEAVAEESAAEKESAEEESAAEGEQTADAAAGNDSATESAAPTDDDSADAEQGDEPMADEATGDDAAAPEVDADAIIAERKAIRRDNERLKDEYEDTLAEGREQVDELNARFGDWYYLISEDVYKQIHLSLDDVVQKKESAEGDAAAADENPLRGLPSLPFQDDSETGDETDAQ